MTLLYTMIDGELNPYVPLEFHKYMKIKVKIA